MSESHETPEGEPDSDRSLARSDVPDRAAILVADPDPDSRRELERLLRTAGFKAVSAVPDAGAALASCKAEPPDVILLRAGLGEGDGQDIAARLRDVHPDRCGSVVFLTDSADPAVRNALLDRGDDCLTLPRDAGEIVRRVSLHAMLHIVGRALRSQRESMERTIAKRTDRLNRALDLLRDAEQRLERELMQARSETRERIDYFAETQHELRTPLNAICGMSDAIRNEMFGPLPNTKYKDYADHIYKSGQHLLSIIDGRLELSRLEAGAEPLELEPVDVSGVVQETAHMLERIAEKADVELRLDIEPNLPVVETDRRKLRQALVNLVSNAIKFTPEKGRVTLSVNRNAQKGVLILVVSDTGIGMSANDIRAAMKPYRRLSGDARSGERGAGLGLSIVHKLVETLGATIEIDSAPGRGTSIKIELPIAPSGQTMRASAAG